MNAIVVYYSLEGNTDFAARKIAEALGADLLRIRPAKSYPTSGFRKFLWGGKSAVMAEKPELEPYEFDASAHDTVVLGFPVWASNVAPPLRTFVHDNDLVAMRVAAFACQSGNGAQKAFDKLESAMGKGLEARLVLIDPKDKPTADNDRGIAEFCATVGARES